ncbi:sortase [Arthrobacter sp. Leaf337]|uniref:class F sortase n=1 Tax=Arthrobacter sp. Leaf337 TaxID=1736342 RepID=UPI0006F60FB2|nr:class F sortase [Arthrobacter sp. Leaf337]KQR82535.1 sortase [Arthrobacter sp. Leaf337]
MVCHVRYRHRHPARIRSLVLNTRDLLVLAFCVAGILGAWLAYGVTGSGNHGATAAGEPAAIVLSGRLPDPLAQATMPAAGAQAAESVAKTDPVALHAVPLPAEPLAAGGAAPAAPPAPSYPAAAAPQRIIYPAAGMDVVVHPLEPESVDAASHSIVPPETMDGYWLANLGTPGAGSVNTSYVIGHSWEGLDAPFNHLSSAAAAGDELTVATSTGAITYRVDSVTTYTKATLKDSPIWAVVPNRLVLISCYTEDPWGKNVAVVASPLPGR